MGNHLIGHPTNLISAIFGDQLLVLDLGQISVREREERVCERQKSLAGSTLDPVFRRDSSDVIRNN